MYPTQFESFLGLSIFASARAKIHDHYVSEVKVKEPEWK